MYFITKLKAIINGENTGPEFVGLIGNAIAIVGDDVSISCIVRNLGNYKVNWFHINSEQMLTVHTHVVSRIPRYGISASKSSETNTTTWTLIIRNVKMQDQGYYMCQVTTHPMKGQVGYITIQVPPKFREDNNSSVIIVQENSIVKLHCSADGNPTPKITWEREDGRDIVLSKYVVDQKIVNETLHFERVNRDDAAGYYCLASNGVPPTIRKRIYLDVVFPPITLVSTQLAASEMGSVTSLECEVEANPTAIVQWLKDRLILTSNDKYAVKTYTVNYKIYTELRIYNVSFSDFGQYICEASNSLGRVEGLIRLYLLLTTSTTAIIEKSSHVHGNYHNIIEEGPVTNQSYANEVTFMEKNDTGQSTVYKESDDIPSIYQIIVRHPAMRNMSNSGRSQRRKDFAELNIAIIHSILLTVYLTK